MHTLRAVLYAASVCLLVAALGTQSPTATPTPTETTTITGTRTESGTATGSDTESRSPSPTPSRTASRTSTPSATPTAVPTFTPTRTATRTRSATQTTTGTRTLTPTRSMTPTLSPTRSATRTTISATRTKTLSPTVTLSGTRTRTWTNTLTPSRTNTLSSTVSRTATRTKSLSPTVTLSDTRTRTRTNTITPSRTNTLSGTYTPTRTATLTPSRTNTLSGTRSPTATLTLSPTKSRTVTPSTTITPSRTRTGTATRTRSGTPTRTESLTPTATMQMTASYTRTPTRSTTLSATISPTPSVSLTPSRSPTPTRSATATRSSSLTASRTATATRSRSITPTVSMTPSRTATATPSNTLTATRSQTKTPTATATRTRTPSPTSSPTSTRSTSLTPTLTGTGTRSATPTTTRSPSTTRSATPSRTHTSTSTRSATATLTSTDTPTMTVIPTYTGTPTMTVIPTHTATPTASRTQTYTAYSGSTIGHYDIFTGTADLQIYGNNVFYVEIHGANLSLADRMVMTPEPCSTLSLLAGQLADPDSQLVDRYMTKFSNLRVRCGVQRICYLSSFNDRWYEITPPVVVRWTGCRPDYQPFGSKCYRLSTDLGCWAYAENYCRGDGGYLASASDQNEWDFLVRNVSQGHTFWTGGYVPLTGAGWPTMVRGVRQWRWVDDSAWNYTRWGYLQPDTIHENCLEGVPTTGEMNDALCPLPKYYVCQSANPFYGVNNYTLLSGVYGTDLTLEFNGGGLYPEDRVLLLLPGQIPPPATNLTLVPLPNEIYPPTVDQLGGLCGPSGHDQSLVTYTAHNHNATLLTVWYLLAGSCSWLRLPDLELPRYVAPVYSVYSAAAFQPVASPEGCTTFLLLVHGSAINATDRIALLPYPSSCPTSPSAGQPIGPSYGGSTALVPYAPASTLVTWRVALNLRQGSYAVCFLTGTTWIALRNNATGLPLFTVAAPTASVASGFSTVPAQPVTGYPFAITFFGANLSRLDYWTASPGACPGSLPTVALPPVGSVVNGSGSATQGTSAGLTARSWRICYLRCGAASWTDLGALDVSPPIVTEYFIPGASLGALTPATPYVLVVNGSALSHLDRIALQPFYLDCSAPTEPLTFPALADPLSQQRVNVTVREGSWRVCYQFNGGAWVDITSQPLVATSTTSAVTVADYQRVRLTDSTPFVMYFNGTGLSGADKYTIVDATSSCPAEPFGGTPVTPGTAFYTKATLQLPAGDYRACYLRGGSGQWEAVPTLCPSPLFFNFTCANAATYNATCGNFTVLPPQVDYFVLLSPASPSSQETFTLQFHGYGLSSADLVDISTSQSCPTTATGMSAVGSPGPTSTVTTSRPFVEAYVREACPSPYTTYYVCYHTGGKWVSLGSIEVTQPVACFFRLADPTQSRLFLPSDPEYAFCRMLEQKWTGPPPPKANCSYC